MNTEKQGMVQPGPWSMMRRIQEIGLTLADLAEYLDTHVNDTFAIQRHQAAAEEYRQVVEEYEDLFGPLSLDACEGNSSRWQWALQDFPWDYELL